ncbi:M20/M25/M40 family metallo-hydrolase [Facklamia sp. DSM 111018]|uniref:M20/M25/M40 family metallo-hydrolase n=1 Tax=Facklamia lactis TaxID=2749967 RepID=A0ABS0LP46_9LACT|nr:M20/M25/M40 family metallo-hydrolase [Facklamia lactis]MBG9985742.1 M20/M25/M40 family metallo-hydrolase [Facklamia lactis]
MRERTLQILEEMLLIHSPSKQESKMTEYIIQFLEELEAEIYLDHNQAQYGGDSPVVFAKIKGNIPGEGVTLNGHTDVIQPNENLNIIKEEKIWKTDGTTTLGGDDKAGLAAILSSIEYLKKHHLDHQDIYVIITPGEEQSMLGARHIDWENVYKHIQPAKNIIVVDNAGKADKVAYQAPTCYKFSVTIRGIKAHAGIEPEKGKNAIKLASQIISEMDILRIDDFTTANISTIHAEFPSNVVPDECTFTGEIRSHSQEKVENILSNFETIIKKYADDYEFKNHCEYPELRSQDELKFVNEMIDAYQEVGVKAEDQIIGGGSDANFFAGEGFNAAIIGVGMQKVHTTEEYLEIDELMNTTQALIKFLSE